MNHPNPCSDPLFSEPLDTKEQRGHKIEIWSDSFDIRTLVIIFPVFILEVIVFKTIA